MDRIFSLDEARSLMPDVRTKVADLVTLRADLAEISYDLANAGSSPLGGIPERKALEARIGEILLWFGDQGIELKGAAPVLVDFPAELDDVSVRLCWVEGETDLAWYHRTELGFAGRRPLPR
ncbi:DUF2203 domain-containing protein [Microtetraspora fusca]|uniref:DUF2203 domain-containing protein n=1 Tax=Microtetraspora fusca TaxID=1997 RepID=A0ABW6VFN8_MICFU|nr:DUF2203 domain-containing protein [Microtetraspora fusca]